MEDKNFYRVAYRYDFKEIKIMPKGLRWEFRCDIFGEELFHKFRSEFSEAVLSYLKIL